MSDDSQKECPKCHSPYAYSDGQMWICPECFYEWSGEAEAEEAPTGFIDVNGNTLVDGDAVTVVKDLKVGGSTIKSGTKVKKIRLLDDPVNGHDISCKIDGHGQVYLKCSVVKKA
ncbi:zinc ribbon domain-containing protein YjdM [Parendozoicomonas haliclonae]|uniref:Alkylphosphonate utilization protein n=1 Tax=Parendozoicomonas haliclonae TaxID=1960125 RepID=A0A1X7ALU0_9GAMM|nr:zinc ribbon domain-containing protein YjdM [Parendozoicomonas haliclonae]SMA49026.1 hypothetical protein EHSB41UT_03007 [Parendozoicomonas haliclonae]